MGIADIDTESNLNYQYNGEDYVVMGTFMNDSKESNKTLPLRGNAFRYIEIVDNIYHPFHTAEVIISNDFNFFDKEYSYLGNGRDHLLLIIAPNTTLNAFPPLTNDDFVLKFDFIITECIDINYKDGVCKKLKLVETFEYKLIETYFNYGQITNTMEGLNATATSTTNSKNTGDWIKQILTTTFPNMGDKLIIKDKDQNEFFESKNSININVTFNSTIQNIKALNYIMQFHHHNDSPCILRFDRTKKSFYLMSYETLFKRNQNTCNEEMHFGTMLPEENINDSKLANLDYRHLSRYNEVYQFGKNGINSSIQEFYIEPPAASLVLDFFAKESVTVYSRAHGTFMSDTKILSPDTIINTYKEKFLTPFNDLFAKYALKENFYLPQSNEHMQPMWKQRSESLPPDVTAKGHENKKLCNLLNLNHTYIIKSRGCTARQSASFIDILKFDREKNQKKSAESEFDLKHMGRHLVTCVKHIFSENIYINKIETIKPYRLVKKDNLSLLTNSETTEKASINELLDLTTSGDADIFSSFGSTTRAAALAEIKGSDTVTKIQPEQTKEYTDYINSKK